MSKDEMQFALGEDTNLRRELGTRDADSLRRNKAVLVSWFLFSLFISIPTIYYLFPSFQDKHGILFSILTSVSIFILMTLATFPCLVLALCFTSYSPMFLYQERICPGFFEQTILGFKRTSNLKYATIKVRKSSTKIRRHLAVYSVCISSTKHSDINLRLLTRSEVDLLLAYLNAAQEIHDE